MSTERSSKIICGWYENETKINQVLSSVGEDLEESIDVLAVECRSFLKKFEENEKVEATYGSDGCEDGAIYFGLSINYVVDMELTSLIKLMTEIEDVMKVFSEKYGLPNPTFTNVIGWF